MSKRMPSIPTVQSAIHRHRILHCEYLELQEHKKIPPHIICESVHRSFARGNLRNDFLIFDVRNMRCMRTRKVFPGMTGMIGMQEFIRHHTRCRKTQMSSITSYKM